MPPGQQAVNRFVPLVETLTTSGVLCSTGKYFDTCPSGKIVCMQERGRRYGSLQFYDGNIVHDDRISLRFRHLDTGAHSYITHYSIKKRSELERSIKLTLTLRAIGNASGKSYIN